MQQSARISPLLHDGEVIGTLTVIDDVTERVAREVQLQAQLEARAELLANEKAARQEAEAANRLKDDSSRPSLMNCERLSRRLSAGRLSCSQDRRSRCDHVSPCRRGNPFFGMLISRRN